MSEDRVVLVPGASGGLGPAVVDTLLSRGFSVAAVARRPPTHKSDRFLGIAADLTKPSDADRAVKETIARFKKLECIVHVMGGYSGGDPLHQTSDEILDRMIDLNLRGLFNTLRATIPHIMEAKTRGRIIGIGSRVAVEPGGWMAAYSASKAAVVALIKSTSQEIRESGATANVLLPSMIDTTANRESDPGADYSQWVKPESIARTIAWLLSDESHDINGATIPIYGRS